ncbi:MAG: xanthine dehydrogenase family protein molybdopterin-binding subunit [Deltaproteobacteria bacterium]|nr:xanthine dehydrogenase family protein molybdopterin-binding subunit [Deltaproteobacteria bacterium]
MSAFNHLGKDIARPEAPDKAAGRAVYIHDFSRPGMLHGKIKFSEHVHARILNIDTSKAERLPGVKAVITAYNSPEVRIGFLRDNFALKKGKVRQFRDEIAAVAAIDPEIAAEAVELIKVEYEPLPAVFSPAEAMREGAPLVHEVDPQGKPRKDNKLSLKFHHESGDLKAGREASAHIVEGEFSTQWIQQSCMGTAGCIAEFDLNQNLTMWAKTQIPFLAQRDFNQMLSEIGLKGKNSRVVVPTLGGAFGSGLDTHAYEYIAILLAHRTGRPVKMLYTRDEEFANLSPRQSAATRIIQGCDRNGKLTFRHIESVLDNGAYTSWGATYPTVMMLPATSLYRVANVSFDASLVYTNNTYSQAMRGYGNPELCWALENNLDELAEKAGIDAFDMRMRNCNEPGELTPMGLKVTTCGLKECLTKVASKLDWKEKRGKGGKRGVGMASLVHVGGGGRIYRSDGSGIILKLDDFGNVNAYYGGVEMGQGLHSVLQLAIAEQLGVRPEKVFVNQTDTATCPWDVGTHASRGAFMACSAAIRACDKLRDKIFEHAEGLFADAVAKNLKSLKKKNPEYKAPDFDVKAQARRDRFDIKDGFLFVKDAPREAWLKVELGAMLRSIHFRDQGDVLSADAFYDPPNELPDFEKGYGNISSTYAYGAQGAEVEVDTDTGEVKILKIAAVHDVGKVLNPLALKGQMYGALAQGVGYALYEEIKTEGGRTLNPNFMDYKIPTVGEMDFPIDLEFVETCDGTGPFGAKGVGEPGLVPTAPAISNAIYDAVGVRIRHLPITPEKVLAALKERDKTK